MIKKPYDAIINKLAEALKKKYEENLISIVVYGSVARGEARKDSDIDLLIVADNLPKDRLKRQKEFTEAEKEIIDEVEKLNTEGYHIEISPIIKTKTEASKISPLYLDMVEDAVIIYDKNNFIRKILERMKTQLKTLGSKRIKMGKKWYWMLKPDYKFGEEIKIE